MRTGGFKLGLITLILDILKGFIAIKITLMLNSDLVGLSMIFVVIGHIFPIWLKFKGGKGVATFIGVLLGYNFQLFLLFTALHGYYLHLFLNIHHSLQSLL